MPGFIGFFARRGQVAEREGFSSPISDLPTGLNLATAPKLAKGQLTETDQFSSKNLYDCCMDHQYQATEVTSKVGKIPIPSRFVELERAKGIEPSYAA